MIEIKYGTTPPIVVVHMPHREPFIIRDKAEMWRLMNDLHEAYQKVFEEKKPPKEEPS